MSPCISLLTDKKAENIVSSMVPNFDSLFILKNIFFLCCFSMFLAFLDVSASISSIYSKTFPAVI